MDDFVGENNLALEEILREEKLFGQKKKFFCFMTIIQHTFTGPGKSHFNWISLIPNASKIPKPGV